jgi:hypothetical protein
MNQNLEKEKEKEKERERMWRWALRGIVIQWTQVILLNVYCLLCLLFTVYD